MVQLFEPRRNCKKFYISTFVTSLHQLFNASVSLNLAEKETRAQRSTNTSLTVRGRERIALRIRGSCGFECLADSSNVSGTSQNFRVTCFAAPLSLGSLASNTLRAAALKGGYRNERNLKKKKEKSNDRYDTPPCFPPDASRYRVAELNDFAR